jgi:tRNA uridine 5-carboxymethylaminomethyl modification enzyme
MKHTLEKTPHLRVVQAEITDILENQDENGFSTGIRGVMTRLGELWECESVIIATGTYPEAKIFIGDRNFESGPDGSLPSKGLSASLSGLGIRLMRFKTGTPARVKRETIDFSVLEVQDGEENPLPFSAETKKEDYIQEDQIPCHIIFFCFPCHNSLIVVASVFRKFLLALYFFPVGCGCGRITVDHLSLFRLDL